ncbi:hypothetical protein [Streptomyces sp. NPDC001508]|uniref:hypothetical protein n=1 Tax=Streptomyces sp. NPDC001508 TaxID=3154656 RepID=UPI003328800F
MLTPYLRSTHEPLSAAALRILSARAAGREPVAADLALFEGNPTRIVRAVADQVDVPTGADRADVYSAIGTLSELADL